ncbi:MAG: hypothetical protein LBV54_05145 [Puniceicoccales bacterium]|jgi:hypothetical protein|nr:hypothetical protein [Puniceicoccales bacterium]
MFLKKPKLLLALALPLLGAAIFWQWPRIDAIGGVIAARIGQPATTESRLAQYGEAVRLRLAPTFHQADVAYPASRLTLICLKEEKQVELWAGEAAGPMHYVKTYPVKAASGHAGPKLREGDQQVPEGLYSIESLNPNSRYHLALRVNYPNADDLARARKEGRKNLGGDIMIHGKAVSIGCLAMGDDAAEELFVLAAHTGVKNIRVLLCPCDLRTRNFDAPLNAPAWTTSVYSDLKIALADYVKK